MKGTYIHCAFLAAIAVVLSALFNALSKGPRADATVPSDYY